MLLQQLESGLRRQGLFSVQTRVPVASDLAPVARLRRPLRSRLFDVQTRCYAVPPMNVSSLDARAARLA